MDKGEGEIRSKKRGYNLTTVIILVAVMTTTIATVTTSITITTRNQARDEPDFFSPGDSRIVSYGSTFICAGVTLIDTSNRTGSTLYLITEAPPLTDRNNFTIINNDITLADSNYQHWSYYLSPNSNFSTEVCTRPNSADGTFYLIKGRRNFQEWIRNPSTDRALRSFSISNIPCSSPKYQFSFRVEIADEYYFVYRNSGGRFLRLNVTITVDRFQYSTSKSDLNSIANCSVSTIGECSVPVPYSSINYRGLVVTSIPDNPNWEENEEIRLRCVRRGWAIAIVVILPMVFVPIFILVPIVIVALCLYKHDSLKRCCFPADRHTPSPVLGSDSAQEIS